MKTYPELTDEDRRKDDALGGEDEEDEDEVDNAWREAYEREVRSTYYAGQMPSATGRGIA